MNFIKLSQNFQEHNFLGNILDKIFFATQFMPLFDFDSCNSLYLKNQNSINDSSSFEEILNNSLLFSFYDELGLIGCVYFYPKNEKLFCNAFSRRHSHLKNLICFDFAINSFDCDIYAYSDKKTAILVLLKSDFKKIKNNLFIHKYNPNRIGAI